MGFSYQVKLWLPCGTFQVLKLLKSFCWPEVVSIAVVSLHLLVTLPRTYAGRSALTWGKPVFWSFFGLFGPFLVVFFWTSFGVPVSGHPSAFGEGFQLSRVTHPLGPGPVGLDFWGHPAGHPSVFSVILFS